MVRKQLDTRTENERGRPHLRLEHARLLMRLEKWKEAEATADRCAAEFLGLETVDRRDP
jgi:hypothetical protein